jgi:hypothetical protein
MYIFAFMVYVSLFCVTIRKDLTQLLDEEKRFIWSTNNGDRKLQTAWHQHLRRAP